MGSSRSLAMRTMPGAAPPNAEIARKSIFTGISMARASAVRKNTAPFSTATSFRSRPRYFPLISAATSSTRAATCCSVNRTRSIPGGAVNGFVETIFKYEILKILLIKHLDINMRINRAQQPDFPVFARRQGLFHGGQFHVQIELRQ